MRVDHVDHDLEESVERGNDFARAASRRQRRAADDVDEQGRGLDFLAAELHTVLECLTRHVLAHVATEEVTQLLALPHGEHHPVEARLQLSQFS